MRTCVFFFAFICIAQSRVIWENGNSFQGRLQYIPPLRETAKNLMTFFLNRNSRLLKHDAHMYKYIPFDTIFIVDSSSSLKEKDFKHGLQSLKELIVRSRPDSKFAGILFSDHANITFSFVSPKLAVKGIDRMTYVGGKTNTQAALKKARRRLLFNRKSGLRMESFKRIFLLTDGQSNVKQWATLHKALQLKMMGVEIFVMAVGDSMPGINELVSIASSSDTHLFRVKSMADFEKAVKMIPVVSANEEHGSK